MTGAVVVTGAAGFVGSHLVRALRLRGRDVVAVDLAAALPSLAVDLPRGAGELVHVRGDVTDPGDLLEALLVPGVEDVVHAAALLADAESLQRPRAFLRVNAEAVWGLCELARRIPTLRRVLTVSTRSVYGAYTPEEGPLSEDVTPRPVGFYGAAKAAADLAVTQYRRHYGLDVVAARITGAYGQGQTYANPLGEMIEAALSHQSWTRDQGGDFLYEFTYVKDVVRALLLLLDAPMLDHPIYNVGFGELRTLREAADVVRSLVPGARIEIGVGNLRGAEPRAALSIQRLANELGFTPRWSLDEGVADNIGAVRENGYGAAIE